MAWKFFAWRRRHEFQRRWRRKIKPSGGNGNAQDDRNVCWLTRCKKASPAACLLEDLGLKRSHFEVLRLAHIPAILVEGGFLSNPQDAKNIYDSAFRKRMAHAIVDGIVAYKRALPSRKRGL
jgi:N-acetylmuramoyl-L-alanine amidase